MSPATEIVKKTKFAAEFCAFNAEKYAFTKISKIIITMKSENTVRERNSERERERKERVKSELMVMGEEEEERKYC